MKEVVIVSAVRTPMGSFMGSLSSVSATDLGAVAIKAAVEKAGIDPNLVQEVFMGNVLQAGVGQAPARQAALKGGLSNEVPSTTINKVCASGMKAIMLGAQSIMTGMNDIVIAGGMESMSNAPHYVSMRNGHKYGDAAMKDGIVHDGLMDVYTNQLMGNCAELCAKEYNFSREDQDNFAIESYKRSARAWENGWFNEEVVPVAVPQRKGEPKMFAEDEEYKAVNFEKMTQLRAVFEKDGTITAANASTINDGASALVLMSAEKAAELGLKPLAKIKSFADAAQSSEWFTTAPSKAVPIALGRAGLEINDVDFWEFNEAFSVVSLANMKILGLDPAKVDVHGGAVSLGHPLGNSGSRVVVTLINVLKQHGGKIGGAAICNGGGGASAIIIELV
ncbi:MAG: acetyl-CoA C-acyltransferase [Salibacteraceae bacterium]|nr:acetyl-CoA C-acyltransferase [Salibacteraceae bacterium]MDP4686931.1 acetyl-CoA C-acyltransferase [Salibacteraceae bacterium]MDP4762933.1 acetyl-CoA C-acyltransferase [Salibacteraceae bacterium]MDP4844749.1 acetyl-CoA C-acyltransferase [Salibacteraceae bacterium]MDP4934815.1 acetyl-CoA C-acyltransferase [Salibacteraceae bacterium]